MTIIFAMICNALIYPPGVNLGRQSGDGPLIDYKRPARSLPRACVVCDHFVLIFFTLLHAEYPVPSKYLTRT